MKSFPVLFALRQRRRERPARSKSRSWSILEWRGTDPASMHAHFSSPPPPSLLIADGPRHIGRPSSNVSRFTPHYGPVTMPEFLRDKAAAHRVTTPARGRLPRETEPPWPGISTELPSDLRMPSSSAKVWAVLCQARPQSKRDKVF